MSHKLRFVAQDMICRTGRELSHKTKTDGDLSVSDLAPDPPSLRSRPESPSACKVSNRVPSRQTSSTMSNFLDNAKRLSDQQLPSFQRTFSEFAATPTSAGTAQPAARWTQRTTSPSGSNCGIEIHIFFSYVGGLTFYQRCWLIIGKL